MNPDTFDQQAVNERLKELLMDRLPGEGEYAAAVPGLTLYRREGTARSENCFYQPLIALILQGNKRSIVGSEEYEYGANHCFICGVDMPSLSYMTGASPERPFLGLTLNIDCQLTSGLAAEFPQALARRKSARGMAVAPTDPYVLEAFLRLVELDGKPDQIPAIAPLIIREIHFRLLNGPQGEVFRLANTAGTLNNQVFQAITWLRDNFTEPLQVDRLARQVHMSPPSFRRHFKQITTMSPTQYLKRLRLYEAQRLMLVEKADATRAGYAVGYESPSQFSREYKRLFGEAPQRNISRMQSEY